MKRLYFYLFYKLYKFWEVASTPEFWSGVKAIICLIVLEEFIVASLMAYYQVFIDKGSQLLQEKWIYVLIGVLIIIPKYFIFLSENQWKQIVNKFDKQPERKNNISNLVILIIVLAIIANFFIAFYLYLQ